MKRTPLIILNGFLGAGKTTLLKNLLTQAHKRRMTVSVIVNDMSELDVDGVLIANTEIVDAASNNFVSISADSISSRSGIQKLDSALKNLLEKRSADFILLETSGSSHPLPLVRYLREHTQVSLKAFLSLVDTVMLNDDYDGGKKLIPVFQEHLNKGTRGVESLLAEQIMFCNKLLLTKNDRLPFYVVTEVARAIHPLNPQVAIMAVPGEIYSWMNCFPCRITIFIGWRYLSMSFRMPLTQFCRMKPIKNTIFRGGSLRMTVHFIRSGCGIPAIASWAQAFTAARGFSGYREGMTWHYCGTRQQGASISNS